MLWRCLRRRRRERLPQGHRYLVPPLQRNTRRSPTPHTGHSGHCRSPDRRRRSSRAAESPPLPDRRSGSPRSSGRSSGEPRTRPPGTLHASFRTDRRGSGLPDYASVAHTYLSALRPSKDICLLRPLEPATGCPCPDFSGVGPISGLVELLATSLPGTMHSAPVLRLRFMGATNCQR
jgi:hypothetical protein